MIRVLLADDQALVRAGFRALIDAEDDLRVIGEAADGDEAVHLAARLQPDVILMDVRMPRINGIEAAGRILRDAAGRIRIIMLTTFDLDEYIFEALRAGASGFLVKDTEPAELIRAIRVVQRGDSLLSPGVTRRLIGEFVSLHPAAPHGIDLSALTEREREVMVLVAAGLSNEEIAARLLISPATAKTHVSRTMLKLGARDRAQLVVFAFQCGLARAGAAG